ncbi:hypothetical protein BDV25DRAFT_67365 [Aspergillus avenaceus]|uniref:Uncharacterized protein n=1 Tax=Aspergillus avenaceus TaxID=36643 RepID=A0A5N6U1D3_ASPAV|nr:hypothetical protein BDV25DRAFT_67365 [Aspergillus avenaceus]
MIDCLTGEISVIDMIAHETDTVLGFFASVVIWTLHTSGFKLDILWASDMTKHKEAVVNYTDCLGDDNVVLSYFSYLRKAEKCLLEASKHGLNRPLQTNSILSSINLDTRAIAHGYILITITQSSLLFIHSPKTAHTTRFDYFEIPIKYVLRVTQALQEQHTGRVLSLSLDLDSLATVSKNGQSQMMEGQTLILQSNENLGDLRKAMEVVSEREISEMKANSIRRASSITVSLDPADMVLRKSKRLAEARLRKANEDLSENVLPEIVSPASGTPDQDTKMYSEPSAMLTGGQRKASSIQIGTDGLLQQPSDSQRPKTLLSSRRSRIELTDTQESLIFHSHRFTKKVYTLQSKEPVDWEEDLRPSDEVDEPGSRQRDGTAAVASPAPEDKQMLDVTTSTSRKRKNRTVSSFTRKRQKPAGRTDRKTKGEGPRRLGKSSTDSTALIPGFGETTTTNQGHSLQGNYDTLLETGAPIPRECPAYDSSLNDTSRKDCSHLLHTTKDTHALRATSPFSENKNGDRESSDPDVYHNINLPSAVEGEVQGKGRGRNVGEKLTAAFNLDTMPEQDACYTRNLETPFVYKLCKADIIQTAAAPEHPVGRLCDNMIPSIPDTTRSGYEGSHLLKYVPTGLKVNRISLKVPEKMEQKENDEGSQKSTASLDGNENITSRCQDTEPLLEEAGTTTIIPLNNSSRCQSGEPSCKNSSASQVEGNYNIPATATREAESYSHSGDEDDVNTDPLAIYPISEAFKPRNAGIKPPREDVQEALHDIAELPRATPKTTIVDKDGSPRLLFREEDKHAVFDDIVHRTRHNWYLNRKEKEISLEPTSEGSGYQGSMEEDSAEGPIDLDQEVFGSSKVYPKSSLTSQAHDIEDDTRAFLNRSLHWREAAPASLGYPRASGQRVGQTSFQKLASVDPQLGTTVAPSAHIKRDTRQGFPNEAIQKPQVKAQSMLLGSGELLKRELENERYTVNEALETYRQQCHSVLDKLFAAQEERIRLCTQQMDAIQHHHADICKELIHRLELKERCAQNRESPDQTSSSRKRKRQHED